jgi:hypothetical protein
MKQPPTVPTIAPTSAIAGNEVSKPTRPSDDSPTRKASPTSQNEATETMTLVKIEATRYRNLEVIGIRLWSCSSRICRQYSSAATAVGSHVTRTPRTLRSGSMYHNGAATMLARRPNRSVPAETPFPSIKRPTFAIDQRVNGGPTAKNRIIAALRRSGKQRIVPSEPNVQVERRAAAIRRAVYSRRVRSNAS